MSPTLNEQLGTTEILWQLTDLYQCVDDPKGGVPGTGCGTVTP